MSKIIVLLVVLCTFCIKNDATQLHMKNKIQKHLTQTSESEDECDSNIFLIISRKTGYNLTLAYQVFNENGNNYYWTVTNQDARSLPNTDKWVKCKSGIKNIYNNQYLYIDHARNAVLVDKIQLKRKVDLDQKMYIGYTVIELFGSYLTNQDDGATYFAANYKGTVWFLEIHQQWSVHYI